MYLTRVNYFSSKDYLVRKTEAERFTGAVGRTQCIARRSTACPNLCYAYRRLGFLYAFSSTFYFPVLPFSPRPLRRRSSPTSRDESTLGQS